MVKRTVRVQSSWWVIQSWSSGQRSPGTPQTSGTESGTGPAELQRETIHGRSTTNHDVLKAVSNRCSLLSKNAKKIIIIG